MENFIFMRCRWIDHLFYFSILLMGIAGLSMPAWQKVSPIKETVYRAPAGGIGGVSDCVLLARELYAPNPQILASKKEKEIGDATLLSLQKLSYEARLKFFQVVAAWRGESEGLNRRFANFINRALDQRLLSKEDLQQIVQAKNLKGYRQLHVNGAGYLEVRPIEDPRIGLRLDAVIDPVIGRSNLKPEWQQRYRTMFKELEIYPEDLQFALQHIDLLPENERKFEIIRSYMEYCLTYANGRKLEALSQLNIVQELPLNEGGMKIAWDYAANSLQYALSTLNKELKMVEALPASEQEGAARRMVRQAMAEIKYLFSGDQQIKDQKYVIIFRHYQNRVSRFRKKAEFDLERKYRPLHTSQVASLKATKEAQLVSREYEKMLLGCRLVGPSVKHENAARRMKLFFAKYGLPIAAFSYWYQKRDQLDFSDKEKVGKWFGLLGYDLAISALYMAIQWTLSTNPNDLLRLKYLKYEFFDSTMGGATSTIFDTLWGIDASMARARWEKVKQSPDFEKEMDNLVQFVKENGLAEEYKKMVEEIEKISKDEENQLTPQDLENSTESIDAVLGAIALQLYHERRGVLDFDNLGYDHYVFNRMIGFAYYPVPLINLMIVYRMLCMADPRGQINNPQVRLGMAVGLYFVDRMIYNQLYFKTRREFFGK
jgi:hypothetical protein